MEPLYYQTPYVKNLMPSSPPAVRQSTDLRWNFPRPDFTRRAADSRRTPDGSGKCT
ncbi:MAG: hypothetical protein ACLTR6_06185 [Clostridium fessum]